MLVYSFTGQESGHPAPGGIPAAYTTTLAFDPAIWVQDVYCPQSPASERVGLGVISHLDVNLHLPPDQRMDEET
jgi:hypothetical protein